MNLTKMGLENEEYTDPCPICMGFCSSTDKSILCDYCQNWFHQRCEKISNVKFNSLSNENALFKCSLCIKPKTCHSCGVTGLSPENSIYCVTCLEIVCEAPHGLNLATDNHFLRTYNIYFLKTFI